MSGRYQRKTAADGADLVTADDSVLPAGPRVLVPRGHGVALAPWLRSHREQVERDLLAHGVLLFRGFQVSSADEFGEVAAATGELIEYHEPATPRGQYLKNVYVSSAYPSYYTIPVHGELSYTYVWPRKALFFCKTPPGSGGQTPVADAREVLRRIDPKVRDRFIEKQVMYVRNYGDGFVVPWRAVFKTESREEVELYCKANAPMTCEWFGADRLRTSQVRPAVARHPVTSELVWFNQAHIFHAYSLGSDVKEGLIEEFGEENLPVHARYGDGTPIPDAEIQHLLDVYAECATAFDWEKGDVLVADNMLMAHGRNAFEGEREIMVSFVDSHDSRDGGESS